MKKQIKTKSNTVIRYLVLVMQGKNQTYVGFIGQNKSIITQSFDGTEKHFTGTKELLPKAQRGFKQLSKVFENKKEANKAIKEQERFDVAFKTKGMLYEIVPFEV